MSDSDAPVSEHQVEKGPEDEPQVVPTPTLPPEEGRKGWLCVIGAFGLVFCSFGFLNAMGLFQSTYQITYLKDYTPSEISWIFAFQLAMMWIPGPLFGRVLDTYGPGPIMYPSAFLCVFSLCMTSLSKKYYQIFLAQGVGFGIGAGGCFTTAFVCVGQWFVKRRGLGIGVASAGSSLGGVIFPLFFNKVMEGIGFDGAVRYTALFIGILLVGSCCLVTSRLPRKKWNPKLKWFDLSIFKDKAFALYTLGSFFCMWGLWAPFDYLTAMAQTTGFSTSLAVYLISIMNATSVPGRVIPPYLGDKIGFFNVITTSELLTGISILALWIPFDYHHSHAGLIVFSLVYGLVSGAFVSLLMPCVAKSGTVETLGVRFGTFQPIIGLSCLTGLPIMGAILARQHDTDFIGLQAFGAGCIVIGTIFTAASDVLLRKKHQTWKV